MKKLILSCVALMATFFCASTVSAQGVKIHKTSGEVIDVPAAELDYIEAYDAAAEAPAFEGTWIMKKLISTRESMNEYWGGMVTFNDAFPSFDGSDKLTFKDGKLIPDLKSALKNYFIGEATYELVDQTCELHVMGVMQTITLQLIKVKGVNRNFDANSKSDDDEALLGLRLVEDEDADEAGVYSLEVYILDYEATSFAAEWVNFQMYADEKPVATLSGMPVFFSMVRE